MIQAKTKMRKTQPRAHWPPNIELTLRNRSFYVTITNFLGSLRFFGIFAPHFRINLVSFSEFQADFWFTPLVLPIANAGVAKTT